MLKSVKTQNPLTSRNNPRQLFTVFLVSVFFLAFLLITLQQIGTPAAYLNYLAFVLLFLAYPIVGFLSRTMQLDVYLIAGRRGARTYNGMAIAAAVVSGTVFVALSGEVFNNGVTGLIWITALTAGLVIAAFIFAPAIARVGAVSLPEFVSPSSSAGYSTPLLRISLLVAVVVCTYLLLLGQLGLVHQISNSFFSMSPSLVVTIGLAAVLACLLPGGMRGLTWIRVALYVVVAVAFLVPIVWISTTRTGIPVPQFAYGTGALQSLQAIQQEYANQGFLESASHVPVFGGSGGPGMVQSLVLMMTVAAGAAAMPQILQHFSTSNTPANARYSGSWSILFVLIVITAAPAYAAFIKIEIYNAMVGLPLSELGEQVPWLFGRHPMNGAPLATICGAETVDLAAAIDACGSDPTYLLAPEDFTLHNAMIVLSSSQIAELPPLVSSLLAIGTFAALFSTIDGLLLLIANTLAYDGYHRMIRPSAPQNTILFVSRFVLLLISAGAGYLAIYHPLPVTLLVAGSFSLGAAALFPALVMKTIDRSTNNHGLLAGILTGTIVALLHFFATGYGPDMIAGSGDEFTWFVTTSPSFQTVHSGFLGMIAGFILISTVSRLTRRKARNEEHADA